MHTDDRQQGISDENIHENICHQDPNEVVERHVIAVVMVGRFLEIWKYVAIDPALKF